MLTRRMRVDQLPITSSSFYIAIQKSPFIHQPYDAGTLNFQKYVIVGGAPAIPSEDFRCKILDMVRICHCHSSPDHLDLVIKQWPTLCFAFCSSIAQVNLDFEFLN